MKTTCVLALLLATPPVAAPQDPAQEALAWLKSLDSDPRSAQKQPRFPSLTVDGLRTLTELRLGGHRASDGKHVFIEPAGFRHLAALPALEKANLVEIDGFTDEALAHLSKLTKLTELNLGDAWVTNAGLPQLSALKELRKLDLGWTKDVGDPGLPILAKLSKLEQLGLGGTKITDAGMPALAALPNLKELALPATAVTDRGIQALAGCKSLTTLKLGPKSKVTPKGIEQLKKSLPALTVVTK